MMNTRRILSSPSLRRSLLALVPLLLAVVVLAACGVGRNQFKLEGHLLNMNQGDFYVYSDDGSIDGIDTIHVEGGRFAFEMECKHPSTLYIVFPNFSVQPIFAQPGESVTLDGDASHLKMLEVKGTDDNELMTKFREQVANASPAEAQRAATLFVGDHPDSPVSVWLVRQYFVSTPTPDLKGAERLVALMLSKQPANASLSRLSKYLSVAVKADVGATLPDFTAYDTRGRLVSSSDVATGPAVICTWASWSYDSMDMLRKLKQLRQQSGGRLKVVSLSVDASRSDCEGALRYDSISWPNVCDGMMFNSRVLQRLGLMGVPDNLILQDGRIVARNLTGDRLEGKIQEILR